MNDDAARPYRALVRPALLVAGAALIAFGLAHVAFITWEVDRSQDASLTGRLLQMFFAPVAVGIPFALVSTLIGIPAWRRPSRLCSWRYGVALAAGLLPAAFLSLAHGPYGDDRPAATAVVMLVAAAFAAPAAVGAFAAGPREGLIVGLAALPLALPWSLFLLAEGLAGWVVPFVASIVVILAGAGWAMERLVRAAEPFSGADHSA